MRRRVARKVAKRINAGAPCPRVDGCGYREGTRRRAHAKLRGGPLGPWLVTPLELPYGPSLMSEAYRLFRLHVGWHSLPVLRRPLGPSVLDCTP